MSEETENLQAVREHYEAFGRRDLDAIVAGLDPEVEFVAPGPGAAMRPGAAVRGPKAVLRFLETIYDATSNNSVEIAALEAVGNRVIASVYLHGTWLETGVSGAIPAVHVFTLRDGLILGNRIYRLPPGGAD